MRRHVGLLLAAEAFVLAALLTLALDQYVHAQTDSIDGVNHRGYRGDVAGKRFAGETRIVLAGGATAFEAGTPISQTMLARLQYLLSLRRGPGAGPVTVFNLAAPAASRGDYARQLERRPDLAPDIVCIYAELSPAPASSAPGIMARAFGYEPAIRAIKSVDTTLGRLMPPSRTTDEISDVVNAAVVASAIARGTIVVVPQAVTAEQTGVRTLLLEALAPLAADQRIVVVPIDDSSPVARNGTLEPAAAVQLALPVHALMATIAGTR